MNARLKRERAEHERRKVAELQERTLKNLEKLRGESRDSPTKETPPKAT